MNTKTLFLMGCLAIVPNAMAGTLLSLDFNGENPWPTTRTDVDPSTPLPVETSMELKPVGTVDKAGTVDRTGAMLLQAQVGEMSGIYEATFSSGLMPVKNVEKNLSKLTVSFDLSTSMARPIVVRFESFDSQKRRTGGLEKTIYPPAADFYQRNAIDLSTMTPVGKGNFNPADPYVQIVFFISAPNWPVKANHELRVDNFQYASPAYYVSPTGSETNDGLTESTPLLYPQQAIDRAKPGDIILLMGGEYRRGGGNDEQDGIIHFEGSGTPAAWISVKSYPGQKPVFINENDWCSVRVGGTVRNAALKDSPIGYFEVRGLHIRGQADKVRERYADEIGQAKATTNGNGIGGGSVRGGVPSHHLRVSDCLVEYCPGGGIGFGSSDWVTLENNTSRNNCWFTIYATSGMGTIGTANFDGMSNVYKVLLRNNVLDWNRTYVIWKHIGKISDGNGIIVDVNNEPAKGESYIGRTLIQNNLSTNNGGSGIHCFKAHQVDIVNNTAFRNGATPELAWGQIFFQRTDDAKMINNVLYARDRQPVNTVGKTLDDKGNTNVVRSNNVYFGGDVLPIMGANDIIADPSFVAPWAAPLLADYHLRPGSPALGHGKWDAIVPLTDLDGNIRPLDRAPDAGAYQAKSQGTN